MKKMVVCAVLGGLGNQMFQYAAAKRLALIHSAELCLDLRGFERYPLHNGYELGHVFGVEARAPTSKQLRTDLGVFTTPVALRVLKRSELSVLRPKELVIEPTFQYWDGLQKLSPSFYMLGYWQSEKYFSDVAASIRETFRFRNPLSKLNSDILEEMRGCNSVAIHVRRGDYISHKKTRQIMNLCSMDYYKEAIDLIGASVQTPTFYIFSDDPEWASQNFTFLERKTVVSHNKSKDGYVDMQLMSCCKHQIIANSTFSWWGAWLNEYSEKKVIAPVGWFAGRGTPTDLYPASWLVI
jgi:hypothetical protein